MRFKYLWGAIAANAYRLLKVFPNSDPVMGFVLPAAKNGEWWKAPLFAFATMFSFDLITSGVGTWTIVTSTTYTMIALALHFELKSKTSTLKLFVSRGIAGVLVFDFVTGPIMSSTLFRQDFFVTLLLQVPFTVMHLVSAVFGILVIAPFYDTAISKEVSLYLNSAKNFARALAKPLRL